MAADDGKKHAKPRKIGFLYVMEKARFSTKWVNKFCMLTDANQLDWYLKQEDHVERKIQGSVKKVDQALIEELDATAGRSWAFSLKVKGKTQIFAGEDEQDRLNWVVECIKMRPIGEIIDMCESPKLQRQSAMALCNQSSNTQGNIQLEIVEKGGVTKLLEFIVEDTNKEPDEKLYDAIYFAIGKLATRPENRLLLAGHLERFINLACRPSGNPVWRSSAGAFVHEMARDAAIRKAIHSTGGVARLVDMLVMDKKAPQLLQREAAMAIELLSEDEEIRRDLGFDLLLPLVDAITPVAKQAQPPLVKTLISISRDPQVFAKMRTLTEMLPVVLNLLAISRDLPEEDVQTVGSQFILSLTHENPDSIGHSGMSSLVTCCTSPYPAAVLSALSATNNFLRRHDNVLALASLGTELLPLIRLIGNPDFQTQKLATQIISTVMQDDRSRETLVSISALIAPLLAVASAALASPDEEIVLHSLIILSRISSFAGVKVALCGSQVMSQVIQLISTVIVGRSLFYAVQVCENAADSPFVRGWFLQSNALKIFVDALKSQKDPATLVSLANLLALCATDDRLVGSIVANSLVFLAAALPKTSEPGVRNALVRILRNAAFFPDQRAMIASQTGACLCQQLESVETREEIASTIALLSKQEALEEPLRQLGMKAVLQMLVVAAPSSSSSSSSSSTASTTTASTATLAALCRILAGQVRALGTNAQREFVQAGGVPVLFTFLSSSLALTGAEDKRHCLPELAMLALLGLLREESNSADQEQLSCTIFGLNKFQFFLDSCILNAGSSAPLLESAARSLVACLRTEKARADFLGQAGALDKFSRAFAVPNLVVLRQLCQILGSFCRDKAGQGTVFSPLVTRLAPLLHFPDSIVRHNFSEALIALSTNAKGEIELRTLKEASDLFSLCPINDGAQLASPWFVVLHKAGGSEIPPSIEMRCAANSLANIAFDSYSEFQSSIATTLASSRAPQLKSADFYQRELNAFANRKDAEHPTNWNSGGGSTDEATPQHQTSYRHVLQQLQARPSASTNSSSSSTAATRKTHRKRTSASSNVVTAGAPSSPAAGLASKGRGKEKRSRRGKRESMASSSLESSLSDADLTIDEHINYESVQAILHYRSVADSVLAQFAESASSFIKLEFGMPEFSLRSGKPAWASAVHVDRGSPAVIPEPRSEMIQQNAANAQVVSYNFSDHSQAASVQGSGAFVVSATYQYFEVLILSAGARGTIGIGIAPRGYPNDLQPGWLPGSYGFHGDDGNKYGSSQARDEPIAADSELVSSQCKNESFGPTFTTNDVIGCGYNAFTRELFYTKNGLFIGTAFADVPAGLVPTIGLASPEESVYVNFGQGPFLFDFNFDAKLAFVPAPKAHLNNTTLSARLYRPSHISDALSSLSRDWSFSDRRTACSLAYFSSLIQKTTQQSE